MGIYNIPDTCGNCNFYFTDFYKAGHSKCEWHKRKMKRLWHDSKPSFCKTKSLADPEEITAMLEKYGKHIHVCLGSKEKTQQAFRRRKEVGNIIKKIKDMYLEGKAS